MNLNKKVSTAHLILFLKAPIYRRAGINGEQAFADHSGRRHISECSKFAIFLKAVPHFLLQHWLPTAVPEPVIGTFFNGGFGNSARSCLLALAAFHRRPLLGIGSGGCVIATCSQQRRSTEFHSAFFAL
jgi:hypothetical protein